ncbi:hypothetical protein P154DRAFT_488163 [Amniculicola lignicola CBS 123094]|uniref:Voltage-gated hydrogen channel 1 n=1 Tax=Amniculicola lignicola CBS 123094 TaxID=1392246 RepID=A0A6A5WLE4_9PLEO|nr:hypothetical protein P154DRAFT_488163 [Amniculicola lignicola CBS 123094]
MSSSPLLSASNSDCEPKQSSFFVRQHLHRFLTSRASHYSILLLVSLDVTVLFADIVISLVTCGHRSKSVEDALEALATVGLVFSCIFVLELIASIWAFGITYFHSRFHIFDASVIIISFAFELALRGVEEEVASLIVVLRLLRVVKIIDEMSVAADEQMSDLSDRLIEFEKENEGLRREIEGLRAR